MTPPSSGTPTTPAPTVIGMGGRGPGQVLTRLVLAAGVWLVVLGFAGAAIAYLGAWSPLVAAITALVAAAVAVRATRDLPAVSMGAAPAAALALAVLAITVWTGLTHSEQVLPRRDSASYLQATIQLAEEHRRPVPVDVAPMGGPETLATDGLTIESPAFYEIGSPDSPSIQPQFMPGPAVAYSLPHWAGGPHASMWLPAVMAGLALLALGLLVAATVGAWWSVPAVLLVGACFPWLHTSRSTYSEPLAALTLGAGFLALALATAMGEGDGRHRAEGRRAVAWRTALLAGLLIGGTSIVRIDALRETMLVVPVAALLLARGRSWPRPLLGGALAATAAGFAVAGLMSWRYLGEIGGSLVPLVGLVALMGLACWGLLRASSRGWSLPRRVTDALPRVLPALVVITGVVLATRPLFMTVRQDPRDPGAMYVARMQAEQGLPVDGGRTYAEHSVEWLSWWMGPAALVVALLALAVLAGRLGRVWADGDEARVPAWAGPLVIATGSSLLTLWRPGITPDHPWADRRLLVVLPLALLLVVVAAAWFADDSRRRRGFERVRSVVAGVVVLAVAAVGVGEATWPHATERVEAGQMAAVERYCQALDDAGATVVLAIDDWAVNQWPQVTRGMCGVPALGTKGKLRDDPEALMLAVDDLSERVDRDGGRLAVIASRGPESFADIGIEDPVQVVDVTLVEDMRILTERPDGTTPLLVQVWMITGP